MFKNLILAILIAIVLSMFFGHFVTEWFDWHMSISDEHLESFGTILAIIGIVVLLFMIGFIVAISIFGVILFTVFAVIIGLFGTGLSVFWPAILFAIVIYLLVKDRKTAAY